MNKLLIALLATITFGMAAWTGTAEAIQYDDLGHWAHTCNNRGTGGALHIQNEKGEVLLVHLETDTKSGISVATQYMPEELQNLNEEVVAIMGPQFNHLPKASSFYITASLIIDVHHKHASFFKGPIQPHSNNENVAMLFMTKSPGLLQSLMISNETRVSIGRMGNDYYDYMATFTSGTNIAEAFGRLQNSCFQG